MTNVDPALDTLRAAVRAYIQADAAHSKLCYEYNVICATGAAGGPVLLWPYVKASEKKLAQSLEALTLLVKEPASAPRICDQGGCNKAPMCDDSDFCEDHQG